MLRSLKSILSYGLRATDGEIGSVTDFLLDEDPWSVRYLVVDTGDWLPGRKVLLSPLSLGEPDWHSQTLPVNLAKEVIENAPPLSTNEPISMRYERAYGTHMGLPDHWFGGGLWGTRPHPPAPETTKHMMPSPEGELGDAPRRPEDSRLLRSFQELRGYSAEPIDGEAAKLSDLVIETRTWKVQAMVVDTGGILQSQEVLVAPSIRGDISLHDQRVHLKLTEKQLEGCPDYDPSDPINAVRALRHLDFEGRPQGWS